MLFLSLGTKTTFRGVSSFRDLRHLVLVLARPRFSLRGFIEILPRKNEGTSSLLLFSRRLFPSALSFPWCKRKPETSPLSLISRFSRHNSRKTSPSVLSTQRSRTHFPLLNLYKYSFLFRAKHCIFFPCNYATVAITVAFSNRN